MDAVKILGSLLSHRAARTGGGGAVLGQVLTGIAEAKEREAAARHHDPRFAPQHHAPFEGIVRDSIGRHHHAGGRMPPHVSDWAGQYGQQYRQPPVVRNAPRPRHDVRDNHCSGLGYNQRAELLIQAMIMASQADGKIDAAEQDRIIGELHPLDRAESDYLRREFGRRHDVHAFVHALPQGMEYEVYQISLMTINLDTRAEANYLRELAKCLRIDPQVCNQIHYRCGAPPLF